MSLVPGRLALVALLGACSRGAPAQPPEAAPAAVPAAGAAAAPAATLADPYHPPPRDTVELPLYRGWQQYSLQCARCHGEDGQGSSFGPSLVQALRPEGTVPTREDFMTLLTQGREEKGMPSASKIGLDSTYFDGLYRYLAGRAAGRLHGGRPARRESE